MSSRIKEYGKKEMIKIRQDIENDRLGGGKIELYVISFIYLADNI